MRLRHRTFLATTILALAGSARAQYVYVTYSAANAFSVVGIGSGALLATYTPLFSGAPFPAGSGPCGVAVTPDSLTAYFTFLNTAPTSVLNLNVMAALSTTTSALMGVGTGASTYGVLASPDDMFIYAAGLDSSLQEVVIQISAASETFNNEWIVPPIADMAISPDSSTLYLAVQNTGTIIALNVATGVQTPITPLVPVQALVAAPDGVTIYGASGSSLFQGIVAIDVATGNQTLHPIIPVVNGSIINVMGMKLTGPGDTIFLNAGNYVYAISTTTWLPSYIVGAPPAQPLSIPSLGIAVSADNSTLLVLNNGGNLSNLLQYSAATGALLENTALPFSIGGNSGMACGIGTNPPPPVAPPPAVSVTPSPVALYAGQQVKLTVAPLAAGDTVKWSLAPGALGTLSSLTGPATTYTAPASISQFVGAPVTATVTNPAIATRTAAAAISLLPPIQVTVAPSAPVLNPLYPGQSQTLTAAVQGAVPTGVNWSIPAGAPGSITPGNGQRSSTFPPQLLATAVYTYSGPPVTQPTQVVVSATSVATPAGTGTYTVTLSPAVGLTVTPTSGNVVSGATQQLTAQVLNAGNTAVAWSASAGSLSATTGSTVTWTAPTVSAPTQVTITATSVFDNTKSATATFQVSPPTAVTIVTVPAGLQFSLDGGAPLTAPQTRNLAPGAHSIGLLSPQPGPAGTQYQFINWSDSSTANPRTITVGASAANYTANFGVQYLLTTAVAPAGAGSVAASPSSVSGYYTAGTKVQLTALPNGGSQFSNWTADLSGSANPQTIAMNAPHSVIANFAVASGGSGTPSVIGTSPASGNTAAQSFTFTFSDSAGYQSLSVVNVLINNFLDGRHACFLAYSVPSTSLYLVDDGGDAGGPFAGGVVLGNPGTAIQNSQCSVNLTSATGSGNTLTLVLNIAFNAAFAGNKIQYLAARDNSGGNTDWQGMGVWQAPPAPSGQITVISLTPARNAAPAGTAQTLTAVLTDTKGAADFGVVNVLANNFIDGRQACFLAYVASSNTLYLVDDGGDAGGPFAGGMVLSGAAGTIQNSQCSVSGTGSSAVASGNTLTLTLNLTFKSGLSGNRIVWVAGRDGAGGNNTDWQSMGTESIQ